MKKKKIKKKIKIKRSLASCEGAAAILGSKKGSIGLRSSAGRVLGACGIEVRADQKKAKIRAEKKRAATRRRKTKSKARAFSQKTGFQLDSYRGKAVRRKK